MHSKVLAMGIGNMLEWYDFAIFGALADVLGDKFFPNEKKQASLIASLSVFGSAFLMRPIGGILMGYIGDTIGRKRALEISIGLMLVPSFLIGCIFPFSMWRYLSTILLIFLRLLQGMAVGGELVGAFVFTIESTYGRNRGFWGAICKSSGIWGTALGMGLVAILRITLSTEDLYAWGWRIPFLSTFLLGVVGIWLRSYLVENEQFEKLKSSQGISSSPILATITKYWMEVILVILVAALWCTGYYTCFVWMAFYMSSLIGEGEVVKQAWVVNFWMTIALIFLMPMAGKLGDYVCSRCADQDAGFRYVMILGCGLIIVTGIPAFALINHHTWWSACIGQFLFAVALSLLGGNLPAFMVMQFSTEIRYSGVGLAYNLANALFAGTAPLIQTALVISEKHSPILNSFGHIRPVLFLVTIAFISISALIWLAPYVQRRRKLLEEQDLKDMLQSNSLGADSDTLTKSKAAAATAANPSSSSSASNSKKSNSSVSSKKASKSKRDRHSSMKTYADDGVPEDSDSDEGDGGGGGRPGSRREKAFLSISDPMDISAHSTTPLNPPQSGGSGNSTTAQSTALEGLRTALGQVSAFVSGSGGSTGSAGVPAAPLSRNYPSNAAPAQTAHRTTNPMKHTTVVNESLSRQEARRLAALSMTNQHPPPPPAERKEAVSGDVSPVTVSSDSSTPNISTAPPLPPPSTTTATSTATARQPSLPFSPPTAQWSPIAIPSIYNSRVPTASYNTNSNNNSNQSTGNIPVRVTDYLSVTDISSVIPVSTKHLHHSTAPVHTGDAPAAPFHQGSPAELTSVYPPPPPPPATLTGTTASNTSTSAPNTNYNNYNSNNNSSSSGPLYSPPLLAVSSSVGGSPMSRAHSSFVKTELKSSLPRPYSHPAPPPQATATAASSS